MSTAYFPIRPPSQGKILRIVEFEWWLDDVGKQCIVSLLTFLGSQVPLLGILIYSLVSIGFSKACISQEYLSCSS